MSLTTPVHEVEDILSSIYDIVTGKYPKFTLERDSYARITQHAGVVGLELDIWPIAQCVSSFVACDVVTDRRCSESWKFSISHCTVLSLTDVRAVIASGILLVSGVRILESIHKISSIAWAFGNEIDKVAVMRSLRCSL